MRGTGREFRRACKIRGLDEYSILDPLGPLFLRLSKFKHRALGHRSAIAKLANHHYGLVENGRTWQALNDGTDGWIVTVSYKGYTEDEEPAPEDTEQWNLGFDFSEEPIESHPKLKEIKAAFGGYYEEPGGPLKFPEFMPKDSKGKGGLAGKGKAKAGEKNPLFAPPPTP